MSTFESSSNELIAMLPTSDVSCEGWHVHRQNHELVATNAPTDAVRAHRYTCACELKKRHAFMHYLRVEEQHEEDEE